MEKIILSWDLFGEKARGEERYCHNCGRKTLFTDSRKRRTNANGKDLHHFAIYKCERGHTWNKKISQMEANAGMDHALAMDSGGQSALLPLKQYFECGAGEIEIRIGLMQGDFRLDKLLTEKLGNTSRSCVVSLIDSARVTVNHQVVKPSRRLKQGDIIQILVTG